MRTLDKKQAAVRFAVLEAIYWSIFASYASYMTSFGLARGYAQSIVSIMVAVYMVCAFAGQFVWGSASDKLRTNRKVFLLGISIGAVIQLGMYYIEQPVIFGVLYGCLGFVLGPMGSILETWLLKSIRYDVSLYGKSRSMGSAGYAICILIMGKMITKYGFWLMPVVSSIFILATFLIAFITPDASREGLGNESSGGSISLKDIMSIMKIPDYLLVLIMLFSIGLCIAPVNNLKIMVLQSVGGDVATQGVDSFFGCVAQFTMFFISGSLTRIPPRARLLLGSVIVFMALGINYMATAPWMVICGTVMLFGSYSMLVPAAREIVMKVVQYEYQTTANGLVDAVYGSLAGTIALLFAGYIADAYSVKFMIFITLFIGIVPISIMIFTIIRAKRIEKNKY